MIDFCPCLVWDYCVYFVVCQELKIVQNNHLLKWTLFGNNKNSIRKGKFGTIMFIGSADITYNDRYLFWVKCHERDALPSKYVFFRFKIRGACAHCGVPSVLTHLTHSYVTGCQEVKRSQSFWTRI